MNTEKSLKKIKEWTESIIKSIETVFLGKTEVIQKVLVALLCRGHVLIEDVPGVGKTILARAVAVTLGGKFRRVQCTPDLLPADIIGVSVFNPQKATFQFRQGPVFANFLLVDEINRATPRTQSALLEAMAENQVSVEGNRMPLPEPFFVMATENPIEFEGTFPLPEAQKDRFFLTLRVGYPDRKIEGDILEDHRRTSHPIVNLAPATNVDLLRELQELVVQVYVDEEVKNYLLDIVEASRKDSRFQLGVSPRGSLSLYKGAQALAAIHGRDYVIPEDVKELVVPVFSKRVIIKAEHRIKGSTAERILQDVLNKVEVPVLKSQR